MRAGEFSPVEYTQALLERIDALDSALDAFLHRSDQRALNRARAAERAMAKGDVQSALLGIPFALKDIIDVAGLPTTAHSKLLADNIPEQDAAVTERLEHAGAVLLGKLATHEFAIGGPSFDLPWPPARNPWNRDRIPGGSSSGAGAAVAAGLVPIALGTDTGGSVRNPASSCGIVGIKATYGRVSRRGVVPLAFSLDNVGPLTRTVGENAAALNVLAGYDTQDPGSLDAPVPDLTAELDRGIRDLRIGVIRHFYEQDMVAAQSVRAGIESALQVLSDEGASVDDAVTRPLSEYADCNRTILLSEAYSVHEHTLRERPSDYGALTRQRILPGAFLRAVDYVNATRTRTRLRDEMSALLRRFDVLVTASSMEPPYAMGDDEGNEKIYPRQARAPFNVTGHPAISVPIGFDGDGLPLAMQIIGAHFDEVTVYRAAAAYERATRWFERRPPHG